MRHQVVREGWISDPEDDSNSNLKQSFITGRMREHSKPIRTSTLKERVLLWETPGRRVIAKVESTASEVHAVLSRLPAATRAELMDVITSLDVREPVEFWGEEPDQSALIEAIVWHGQEDARRVRSSLAKAISLFELALTSNQPETELNAELERAGASVLASGGDVLIPTWQLDDKGRLLPGVGDVVSAFLGSGAALALWATREHPDLDGRSPAEVLREGDVAAVVYAAERGSTIA